MVAGEALVRATDYAPRAQVRDRPTPSDQGLRVVRLYTITFGAQCSSLCTQVGLRTSDNPCRMNPLIE